ncbi:MAG: DUF11 domain-containing protein, partial [Chloroflexota bacterium]
MKVTTQPKTRRFIAIILMACVPLLLLALAGLQMASAAEQQEVTLQLSGVDLGINKAANAAAVTAGRQLTYSLTISNSGTVSATNVVVSDFLPSGVSLAGWSSTVAGPVCNTDGNPVVCSMGDLEAGISEYITLVVDIAPDKLGNTVNNAEIGSASVDDNTLNDLDSASTTVTAEADLLLSKAASAASVVAGGRLTYTLTITNDG